MFIYLIIFKETINKIEFQLSEKENFNDLVILSAMVFVR